MIKLCFNMRPTDFNKLKFIVVGDNPGDEEYDKNLYFTGKSGKILKNHFERNNLVESFEDECLILNKTFLSTSRTEDLSEIKDKVGNDCFYRILIQTSNEISNYSENLNLPILIFGKTY